MMTLASSFIVISSLKKSRKNRGDKDVFLIRKGAFGKEKVGNFC